MIRIEQRSRDPLERAQHLLLHGEPRRVARILTRRLRPFDTAKAILLINASPHTIGTRPSIARESLRIFHQVNKYGILRHILVIQLTKLGLIRIQVNILRRAFQLT